MKKRIPQVTFLLILAVIAVASPAFLFRSDVRAGSQPLPDFNRNNGVATQGGFDPQSYYRLTTEWQGDGKSLDVVNDGKNNNRLVLADTGDFSGQYWKFTPVGGGYYRLTTEWQGVGKSLDVVNDGKSNNQLILAKTGKFTGQYWEITPWGNGYYRLTTKWQGVRKSLDVVNDGQGNNQLILADTAEVSGQNWKITKVK